MTDLIIKTFIKDYKNTDNNSVREQYGVVASIVGIISNIILFVTKLIIGIFLNSVAITADSFNNLSDAASSIVSLIGFKMANKPADAEHPFGHGRAEYLATFIVSVAILFVGFEFLKSSVDKILNPQELVFSYLSLGLLILTVFIKLWQGSFNKKMGNKINSSTLQATAQDSFNDVIITSTTIICLIVIQTTGFNIDGYVGVLVALFLLYSGYGLAKDTVSSLIGESIPPEIAEKIKNRVESYEGIVGTHDLIVHNYGPNKYMATIHAEVLKDIDIEISHETIDRIERDLQKELNMFLLIHMDPVSLDDERINSIKEIAKTTLSDFGENLSAHDFRIVNSEDIINVIFDIEIPFDFKNSRLNELIKTLKDNIKNLNKKYNIIINVDNTYTYTK